MEKLKELLFDLFDNYEDYENIIESLRSLASGNEITEQEYDIILDNYGKWLKEYESEEV